jgi:hypothetical protein
MLQEELWAPTFASLNASRTGWAESHMPYLMEKPIQNNPINILKHLLLKRKNLVS